jgi:hypothetical protein
MLQSVYSSLYSVPPSCLRMSLLASCETERIFTRIEVCACSLYQRQYWFYCWESRACIEGIAVCLTVL